jgi:hypothetical protein
MPEYGHGQPALDSNIFFGIDATGLAIRDFGGNASNLIFQTTDTIRLALEFEVDGIFAGPWTAAPTNFTVTYFFEQLGGPFAAAVAVVNGVTNAGQLEYDFSVGTDNTAATFALGAVPGLVAGTYKVTAVANFTTAGGFPWPVTAFYEGPVIQIF